MIIMIGFNGDYKEYRLNNGLVVALRNTPTQTVVAKLRVNYGAVHERVGEEGIAHFLEHCLVTGGSNKFDPKTADIIRNSFGYFNAATTIGRTFFVSDMLKEDIGIWIDYVSDHLFNPLFNEERFNGERERVLREISDIKSSPKYPLDIEFNRLFYKNHPVGKLVMGKEEVIRRANINTTKNFHNRGYYPNNMDLIIVGGLPNNIEELINKHFGYLPKGENTRRTFPELEPLLGKVVLHKSASQNINHDNLDESSASIFLSCVGVSDGHKDEYAFRTMNLILGNGTDSFLYQNIGLKKGLAYQARTSLDGDYNAGRFDIHVVVPARRIDESVDAIFEEIQRIKTCKIDNKTIERVRKGAKYNLASAFSSNNGLVSAIGLKLDEGVTPELIMRQYDQVTPERIMEVANKYLPDKEDGRYILCIIDPLKKD